MKRIEVDVPIVYYTGSEVGGFKPQIDGIEPPMVPLFLKTTNKNSTNHYALGCHDYAILKQMIAYYHQHKDIFTLGVKFVLHKQPNYHYFEDDLNKAISLIYQLGYDHLNPENNPDLTEEEDLKPLETVKEKIEQVAIPLIIPKKKPYNAKTPLYKLKALAKVRSIRGFSRMTREKLLLELKKTEND